MAIRTSESSSDLQSGRHPSFFVRSHRARGLRTATGALFRISGTRRSPRAEPLDAIAHYWHCRYELTFTLELFIIAEIRDRAQLFIPNRQRSRITEKCGDFPYYRDSPAFPACRIPLVLLVRLSLAVGNTHNTRTRARCAKMQKRRTVKKGITKLSF